MHFQFKKILFLPFGCSRRLAIYYNNINSEIDISIYVHNYLVCRVQRNDETKTINVNHNAFCFATGLWT